MEVTSYSSQHHCSCERSIRVDSQAQAKVKERPQVCRRGLRTQWEVQVVSLLPGGDEESLIR